MSSTESKLNSSQGRPQGGKPDNSTQPQAQYSPGSRKILPYDDDDDTGDEGSMSDTTDPQQPKIDIEL